MRVLRRKLYVALRARGGETLIESIISLLVLSVLLVTVTTMINIALRTSANSIAGATQMQEETVNKIILSEETPNGNGTISFSIVDNDDLSRALIETHNIQIIEKNGVIAFEPGGTT